MSNIREYPEFYNETILNNYDYYRNGGMEPKEAWETAEHLHRNHSRFQEKIKQIDKLIPFQSEFLS